MKRYYILFLYFFLCLLCLRAQKGQNPEQIIEDILESLSESDIDLNNNSQTFDDLIELYEHPINLNVAEVEDLEKMIFLSDIQIKRIIDFVYKMRPLHSKYQLQGVKGMSRIDIERLMMFVNLGPVETAVVYRKRLDGQLIIRDQFDVEKAKGYHPKITSSSYIGDRHHLYSKLQMKYGNNFYGGVVVDKDPGEEMLPVDFTSGYLMYKGNKLVKTVIVGDYHANFGQGLALWTGTSMGKTTEALNIRKRGEGFRKYSSANEYAFFRGIAVTLEQKNIELSLFASRKDRDADVGFNEESMSTVVESMPVTGYHRTPSEKYKKNVLGQSTIGSNIKFRYKNISVSIGGFYQKLDVDSVATKGMYQYLAHEKAKSSQYWVAYNYGLDKLLAFGEIATDDNGHLAMLNGMQFKPANNVSVSLLHRYFSNFYYSPWFNAFSENSFPSGESGFYLGMNIFPLPKVKLSGYVDVFKTNWLKYNVDKPFDGYDISFQADYTFDSRFKVYLRYREKEKPKNQSVENVPDYSTVTGNVKKIRIHADVEASENWDIQMRVEKIFYKQENQKKQDGVLAYAGIKYATSDSKLSAWLRYSVFDTESYDTRLYAYENDLLYNFYTPSFQGEGSRFYFMIRYQIIKNLKVWLKAGRTFYYDRDEISSGLQTIDGDTRTNIRMQMQFKF